MPGSTVCDILDEVPERLLGGAIQPRCRPSRTLELTYLIQIAREGARIRLLTKLEEHSYIFVRPSKSGSNMGLVPSSPSCRL